jgi:hypothetical protein
MVLIFAFDPGYSSFIIRALSLGAEHEGIKGRRRKGLLISVSLCGFFVICNYVAGVFSNLSVAAVCVNAACLAAANQYFSVLIGSGKFAKELKYRTIWRGCSVLLVLLTIFWCPNEPELILFASSLPTLLIFIRDFNVFVLKEVVEPLKINGDPNSHFVLETTTALLPRLVFLASTSFISPNLGQWKKTGNKLS